MPCTFVACACSTDAGWMEAPDPLSFIHEDANLLRRHFADDIALKAANVFVINIPIDDNNVVGAKHSSVLRELRFLDLRQSAHIGEKCIGNDNGAIGLLVVFEHGD